MAKYKRYDYSQSVLLAVSLQEQLVPGTLEFAIHTLVDKWHPMGHRTVLRGNQVGTGHGSLRSS